MLYSTSALYAHGKKYNLLQFLQANIRVHLRNELNYVSQYARYAYGFADNLMYSWRPGSGCVAVLIIVTDAALPEYSGHYQNSSVTLPKTLAMMNRWLWVSVTVAWVKERRKWTCNWKDPGFWQLRGKSGITEWGGFGLLNSVLG